MKLVMNWTEKEKAANVQSKTLKDLPQLLLRFIQSIIHLFIHVHLKQQLHFLPFSENLVTEQSRTS